MRAVRVTSQRDTASDVYVRSNGTFAFFTALRNAKKGRHGRGRILLGLLSVFLLLWLVGLAVSCE